MTEVTKKNFTTYLNHTVKSDNTVADRCQVMLEFAHAHYKAHGDSRYFAAMMNAPFRASRRDAFRAYAVAFTNLKIAKLDPAKADSDVVFRVDDKSALKTRTKALPVDKAGKIIPWYVFTPEVILMPFDIDARIKSVIKQCTDAIAGKDGKKLKGTKAHAKEQLDALQALISA